ncbi:hypothetical protein PX52LOC_01297 [Limnoglobus roseus]|uniref:Uncharacterized protein n=1 Tax=Limnoglobus roseus TaxID=2598579 RepID=A0A5C1A5I7_9BACT|nr:hypothetical protein PX52LOC_01297 [Limnoglobus roseus]
MSARGYGMVFLLLGLGGPVWLVCAWILSDDITKTYLPIFVGQTAPFEIGFLALGIWLLRKRRSNTPPSEDVPTPPLTLPATRWRELPPNGK